LNKNFNNLSININKLKNSFSKDFTGAKLFELNTTRVQSELSRRFEREKRRTKSG
jgi:hypothetical protein